MIRGRTVIKHEGRRAGLPMRRDDYVYRQEKPQAFTKLSFRHELPTAVSTERATVRAAALSVAFGADDRCATICHPQIFITITFQYSIFILYNIFWSSLTRALSLVSSFSTGQGMIHWLADLTTERKRRYHDIAAGLCSCEQENLSPAMIRMPPRIRGCRHPRAESVLRTGGSSQSIEDVSASAKIRPRKVPLTQQLR